MYGYKAIYQAPSVEIIASHLKGYITISAPALDENANGRWLLFDSDTENGALDILGSFLYQWRWHTILEGRRPGRDGHLWLLLNQSIGGQYLVNLASAMLRLAGVKNSGIEIFPRSARADKLASGIRLPLGIHHKPGAANCRGLFESCAAKDIESQLIWLANQPLNDAATAIELAELHKPLVLPSRPFVSSYRNSNCGRIDILDFVQARRLGKELAAQCPICAAEGHDLHQDNLRISQDGQKFCCWYRGAGQIHKGRDIIQALKLRGKTKHLAAF